MLISNPFPPEEGIGNYVFNLSTKLLERGHNVTVITRGGLKRKSFEYKSISVIEIPFLMAYPFHVDINGFFVNRLLKACEKDFDVVHLHMPLVPAVSTHLPIVTTFHSPPFVDGQSIGILDFQDLPLKFLDVFDYRIEKELIKSSNIVSAVSSGVKLDLERYYHVKPERIRVFGNGVPDDFLEASRSSSVVKDENVILFIGRLEYGKGLLDLIESMKIVITKVPNAQLVIVGKGPLLYQLRRTIAKLKLSKNVQLTGYHSHKEVLNDYLRASIFVLPSHIEGLSTVVLEAMVCKDAVVASDVRGISELVKTGKTGLLVPKKDPQSLAQSLILLLENPDLRRVLSKNASEMIEENYTWMKVSDRVLSSYFDAINHRNQ
jgi:glycosyltransferase involved in cell wall biosynthesis